MTGRLKAMQRVLAVQKQVKHLAEWQLSIVEARKEELSSLGRELDHLLEGGAIAGDLALLGLRQRRRLARRETEATAQHALQRDETRDARSREKLAERMVEGLAQDERRVTERQELERLIESFVVRGAGSDRG